MTLDELLATAAARGASDVHLRAGDPPFVRIAGQLEQWTSMPATTAEHLESTVAGILSPELQKRFKKTMHLDVAWHTTAAGRVRANIFRQRGAVALSLRLIPNVVPPIETLGLAPEVLKLATETRGLVLVTGVTGSGKSTTLAALVDLINRTRPVHILTLEDPIEFVHQNILSVVTQREVGIDVPNYASGVRAALRQDPDVLLIGEMRGAATMKAALTAAATGRLVFSTLHTADAVETVSRIVLSFPSHQQDSIREQLANVFRVSISQRLVPRADDHGLALAAEVLTVTPYIRDCIANRDRTPQIAEAIVAGGAHGMQSFDQAITGLVNAGTVTSDEALRWVSNPEEFKMRLHGITRGAAVGTVPSAAATQSFAAAGAGSSRRSIG